MRLPDELFRRFGLTLVASAFLSGCTVLGGGSNELAAASRSVGPSADYPVVVGEPYRLGNSVYTPNDTLNYDEVGYAAADVGAGISGAHHTLPLPSYVEVTSLESGRTILVRIERRGPMTSDALVALSPAALTQLGGTAATPVRVRRVNPPEEERALLRTGQSVSPRMDTPESLIAVLKRKLPASGPMQFATSQPPSQIPNYSVAPSTVAGGSLPAAQPQSLLPPLAVGQTYAPPPASAPRPQYQQPAPVQPVDTAPQRPNYQPAAPVAVDGGYVVQVAALSSLDNARRVASVIGGQVTQIGGLYRVRTGPFATVDQAEASLAKVRAAGYSEARIFTNG